MTREQLPEYISANEYYTKVSTRSLTITDCVELFARSIITKNEDLTPAQLPGKGVPHPHAHLLKENADYDITQTALYKEVQSLRKGMHKFVNTKGRSGAAIILRKQKLKELEEKLAHHSVFFSESIHTDAKLSRIAGAATTQEQQIRRNQALQDLDDEERAIVESSMTVGLSPRSVLARGYVTRPFPNHSSFSSEMEGLVLMAYSLNTAAGETALGGIVEIWRPSIEHSWARGQLTYGIKDKAVSRVLIYSATAGAAAAMAGYQLTLRENLRGNAPGNARAGLAHRLHQEVIERVVLILDISEDGGLVLQTMFPITQASWADSLQNLITNISTLGPPADPSTHDLVVFQRRVENPQNPGNFTTIDENPTWHRVEVKPIEDIKQYTFFTDPDD
ncbi:MAG: hypothetical protein K0U29_00095 [Gammaproteobacteria bacterium]|nr:hypothetical protein [Gammaproteobacteria bacterium]MCH9743307.1 hypothetical protein [Gammaproteobacteria bacterium]